MPQAASATSHLKALLPARTLFESSRRSSSRRGEGRARQGAAFGANGSVCREGQSGRQAVQADRVDANFGSYNKTYGTLGGVISFLVWLWITNVAILLGMELNAERERSRELDAGVSGAHKEIQLDARSEPKEQKTT